jgi:integrase
MAQISERLTPDGHRRWIVRWYLPGKKGQRRTLTFDDRSEALQWQSLIESVGGDTAAASERWKNAKRSGPTVEQVVLDWINGYSRGNTETRDKYARNAHNHLFPKLGWVRVAHLTGRDVRDFVFHLERELHLSAKTIRNTMTPLNGAMNMAAADGLIAANPCAGVPLPAATKFVPPSISHSDVEAITATIHQHFQLLVHTLARTGLRWSEAEALTCEDISDHSGITYLTVDKAMSSWGSKRHVGPPKTSGSRRRIALDSELARWLKRSVADRAPNDFLFTMIRGGCRDYYRFRRSYLMPALVKAGVDTSIRAHSFRHYHASVLVAAGVDPVRVAARLGHSDPTITLRRYSHLRPGADAETLEALGRVWSDPLADAGSTDSKSTKTKALPGRQQLSDLARQLLDALQDDDEGGDLEEAEIAARLMS